MDPSISRRLVLVIHKYERHNIRKYINSETCLDL